MQVELGSHSVPVRARSGKKKCRYGLRIEAPRGWHMGRGYPPPSRLRGLGERRELPQRDLGLSGAEPRPKTILVRSEGARTALIAMHASEMT